MADLESLEANLEARAAVAGGALVAVQQANEHERNQFRIQASTQREQQNASIAWEFRKVRYIIHINRRVFEYMLTFLEPLS